MWFLNWISLLRAPNHFCTSIQFIFVESLWFARDCTPLQWSCSSDCLRRQRCRWRRWRCPICFLHAIARFRQNLCNRSVHFHPPHGDKSFSVLQKCFLICSSPSHPHTHKYNMLNNMWWCNAEKKRLWTGCVVFWMRRKKKQGKIMEKYRNAKA